MFNCRKKPSVVRIGDENLLADNKKTTFQIDQILVHPDYRAPTYYNDIALIKLRGQITINEMFCPACLWQNDDVEEWGVVATGYGSTSFGMHID